MNGDLQTLCAILRGELVTMPSDEARDRLLDLARAHRVDRLVALKTQQVDDDLRAEAMLEALEVSEMARVLTELESHRVVPLVLKGAALAHTHYDESWLRPRLDIDLLIPRSQRQVVADVLHGLGYTRPPFISGDLVMYQMPFERVGAMGQTHALDVHWRVANPQMLGNLPGYEVLLSRAVSVLVRGQAMRMPRPVDALLLACVHRAAHHDLSDELLWLFDVHLVAERLTNSEWNDFVTLASRCQVRALCVDGLQAAHRCFHTSIPEDAFTCLSDGTHPIERSAMYLRKDLTRVDHLLADLRALSRVEGLRLLNEHLFPSSSYVRQKYGVRWRILLPLLYMRRLLGGLGCWAGWVSWVAGWLGYWAGWALR